MRWFALAILGLLSGCAPELTAWELEQLEAFALPDAPEVEDARADLGRELFYDCYLSAPLPQDGPLGSAGDEGRIACASCHDPSGGGADVQGVALSEGIKGRVGRNAPTVWNAGHRHLYGWTGQYERMWRQIEVPLLETPHGLSEAQLKDRLLGGWQPEYEAAWGPSDPSPAVATDRAAMSLEAFITRDLQDGNSRFDRWLEGRGELSAEELLGARLFVGKAACNDCHSGPLLSDGEFHNLGLSSEDAGRGGVPGVDDPDLFGSFQTPTLRNVHRTAPYMHDGRFADLWEVLDFYNHGGADREHMGPRDPRIVNLGLTEDEMDAIVAFLETLDGHSRVPLPGDHVCPPPEEGS